MSNDYRKIAHLINEIGEDAWQALINPENTGKVKKLAEELLALPTEMTLGGETYEILDPHGEAGKIVSADGVLAYAVEMDAYLTPKVCRHILDHTDEIPVELQGKACFVLPGYGDGVMIPYLLWNPRDRRWRLHRAQKSDPWGRNARLLRIKK